MTSKLLILITAAPPYAAGEEFLNEEYLILNEHFDKIIVAHHETSPVTLPLPSSKFSLAYFPYLPTAAEKVKSLTHIINPVFWVELGEMLFRYRLWPSPSRLAILFGAMAVGKKLEKFVLKLRGRYPDHQLYAYSYWCNFMAVGLAFLKRDQPEITCICRSHGYDLYFERSASSYQPLRRFIYKHLDRVYFVSKTGLDYATAKTGSFPSLHISRLGCGAIDGANKQEEKGYGWIVSCSAALPVKRVHLIISALRLFAPSGTRIKWTHVGGGPMLEMLKESAKKNLENLPNVTVEFAGHIANTELLKFYAENPIDLFINVSASEGIPFSIMEACAAGIPCMATHVGATHELIHSGENGYLLSSNPSADEIKNSLANFLSMSQSEKDRLSKQAKKTWQESFSARQNYQAFVESLFRIS